MQDWHQEFPNPTNENVSHRSQDSATSALCSQWPINLKLTHLELNRETSLIHFQGHYLTTSHLDYSILQVEIQNTPKTKASVALGEVCLVEDVISGLWYRGQVRNENEDTFDVFLIDHGNVLSVDISQMSSCSNDLLDLPPKIVCGFFSNVLPLHDGWDSVMEKYLLSLIGTNVTGYIHECWNMHEIKSNCRSEPWPFPLSDEQCCIGFTGTVREIDFSVQFYAKLSQSDTKGQPWSALLSEGQRWQMVQRLCAVPACKLQSESTFCRLWIL